MLNWLDIIIISIGLIIIFVLCILQITTAIGDKDWGFFAGCSVMKITVLIIWCSIFMVMDRHSGATIGRITSVDKNFFGTTALYIKTDETHQEEYCIEFNEELENKANELIGKDVKITYGKRVGLYSTGACRQSPVESIEEVKK